MTSDEADIYNYCLQGKIGQKFLAWTICQFAGWGSNITFFAREMSSTIFALTIKVVNAVSGFIFPLCMKIKTYLFHKHFNSLKQVNEIRRSIEKGHSISL